MDFIRKNWSRLSLAFLFLIGGVIAVIAWVNNSEFIADKNWIESFYNIALLISTILFFFGMVAVTIVKSLQNSKKAVSVIYMVMGSVISLILIVLVVIASANGQNFVLFVGERAIESFYQLWVPFIVFGLYPLIKGATRFIETTNVPAKAVVAEPVAKPAKEEVVAEAPKAPAKKTASKAKAAK